jgi:methylenetetrahydrofolate reductase (NADPH)
MYSTLHRRLAAGMTTITGEIAPPRGCERSSLEKTAQRLHGFVDAVNLTENQRGMARMSALGAGIIVQHVGLDPIVQVSCQHRNRIAIQSDVLSGSALGIQNFTCMTGDHPKNGDHPDAKSVLDLNSFQIIRMLRQMRDEKTFHSGVKIKQAPSIFVGGVANPNIERVERLEKKIVSGAEFIQTQIIFDTDYFREWMKDVRSAGLHKQAYMIAGVIILRNAETAPYIRDSLPGMRVPDSVIDRMNSTENCEQEGIHLAAETVQDLLSIEGVAGVHLMTIGWSRAIPWVVEQAGLLPRPPAPDSL